MKKAIIKNFDEYERQQSFLSSKTDIMITGGDDLEVSDGFHTFDELYDHRITLFIALCKRIADVNFDNPIWRSKLHSDGSSYDGWFVLGIYKEKGKQITYHLPISEWENTEFAETLEKAPEFDGHSSADVLTRIKEI